MLEVCFSDSAKGALLLAQQLPFFFRNRRIPLRSRPFCAMMQTRTCKEETTMPPSPMW